MSIDAAYALADITYPTDLKLFNKARVSAEKVIDDLCKGLLLTALQIAKGLWPLAPRTGGFAGPASQLPATGTNHLQVGGQAVAIKFGDHGRRAQTASLVQQETQHRVNPQVSLAQSDRRRYGITSMVVPPPGSGSAPPKPTGPRPS